MIGFLVIQVLLGRIKIEQVPGYLMADVQQMLLTTIGGDVIDQT